MKRKLTIGGLVGLLLAAPAYWGVSALVLEADCWDTEMQVSDDWSPPCPHDSHTRSTYDSWAGRYVLCTCR